ncbi:MAG: site-specific integrase, partial [Pirellulaceae bacterium]|nr:site-specific integrase [Pirellulaceae bacterium]
GYLAKLPKIKFLKPRSKAPSYVSPDEFAAIYQACGVATWPRVPNIDTADWWRALLITAYLTGWRISELLNLRRANVDLDQGVAILEAEATKGKRAERVPLHPVVVEHLKSINGFSVEMFPIGGGRRPLWDQFGEIQTAAEVSKPGGDRFGFHDLRRAFATMNADRLTADALQALMRHQSYSTTQKYIAVARQLQQTTSQLFVPEISPPRKASK